ncbi:hypothetical protein BV22DRAFT_26326 [Leucogyrophana mollusca]|uniref:Uncharacterized protein n=1 Tax=Leucogyrophana mollusca TaxID=85980 RepID=A0ACB8BZV4_9AGAM|nr:hypothetical protein BV22DRAFT_26326 [Leucogyrophana mollusca]
MSTFRLVYGGLLILCRSNALSYALEAALTIRVDLFTLGRMLLIVMGYLPVWLGSAKVCKCWLHAPALCGAKESAAWVIVPNGGQICAVGDCVDVSPRRADCTEYPCPGCLRLMIYRSTAAPVDEQSGCMCRAASAALLSLLKFDVAFEESACGALRHRLPRRSAGTSV